MAASCLLALMIEAPFDSLRSLRAGAHDPITTRVTWTGDIARIVRTRCVSCHSPGGRAPMSLATYADARPWARAIREEVLTRRMPKWHAARGYGSFSNDPSLSPFEIALISAWVEGGTPAGSGGVSAAENAAVPDPPPPRVEKGQRISFACSDGRLPEGELLAVEPSLGRGESIRLGVRLPGGQQEIVAWIRNFDPEFQTTYWLRQPMRLPRGSRLIVQRDATASLACSLHLTVAPPRSRREP